MTARAYNNYPTYDDDLVNKAYVDEKVSASGIDPDIENKLNDLDNALKQEVIDRESGDSTITKNFDTFISDDYNPLVQTVDSKIESWSQINDPSLNWSSQVEKQSHLGDIWYNESSQKTYVYKKNESVSPVEYYWQWQDVPKELISKVDSKSTIFSGIIPQNYIEGDYWIVPLNLFENSSQILVSPVGVTVGDSFDIGPYSLIVESINIDNTIETYSLNIPITTNYNLSIELSNESIEIDGYEDQILRLKIISESNIELPENAYGGSICIAIEDGTVYDHTKFKIRNNYIPTDKINNDLVTNDKFDTKFLEFESEINTNLSLLDETIILNVNALNNTITHYDNLTKEQIEDLDNYTKTNINTIIAENNDLYEVISTMQIEFDTSLQLTRDEIIQIIQVAGGTNYLQNSVGFKDNAKWDFIDNYSIQNFVTNLNENITISFKWKKTKDLQSTVKLIGSINDEAILLNTSLVSSEWNTVIYKYTTTSNNPKISILGNFHSIQDDDVERNSISGSKLVFDNGLEITDLYIANGDKVVWSPYFNETYGKSHTLDSDGLTLRNIASDNKIVIDSTSVEIFDGDTLDAVLSKNVVKSDTASINTLYLGDFTLSDIGNQIMTII